MMGVLPEGALLGAHAKRAGLPRLVGQCGAVRVLGRVLDVDRRAGERGPVDVQRMVARSEMALAVLDERRLDLSADLGRVPAAGMEATGRRRLDRAGHVPLEDDPFPLG